MSNTLKDIILNTVIKEISNIPKVDLEKIIVDKFNQIKDEILTPLTKEEKVEDLFNFYKKQINETYINNTNRLKYQLIDIIINEESKSDTDLYFVVYLNKQTKTRLCRTLIDFHSNFKIVK